jgi:hypothetical protein
MVSEGVREEGTAEGTSGEDGSNERIATGSDFHLASRAVEGAELVDPVRHLLHSADVASICESEGREVSVVLRWLVAVVGRAAVERRKNGGGRRFLFVSSTPFPSNKREKGGQRTVAVAAEKGDRSASLLLSFDLLPPLPASAGSQLLSTPLIARRIGARGRKRTEILQKPQRQSWTKKAISLAVSRREGRGKDAHNQRHSGGGFRLLGHGCLSVRR